MITAHIINEHYLLFSEHAIWRFRVHSRSNEFVAHQYCILWTSDRGTFVFFNSTRKPPFQFRYSFVSEQI